MNSISQRNPITSGSSYSAAAPAPATSSEPKDVVTLNLKPEQMTDKSIQAFIRQMALEGTPVSLNFVENGNQSANQAKQAAQEAEQWANKAHVEADRAQQIADRINSGSHTSAPPTYSEG